MLAKRRLISKVSRYVTTAKHEYYNGNRGGWGGVFAAALISGSLGIASCSGSEPQKRVNINGIDEFSSIIVGGGTGGCTAAYFLAKWMEDNDVPGTVLVVDRGELHSPQDGPDPKLRNWFRMWGNFTVAHDTMNTDGSHYPVAATEHRGFGGAGTHDTRITFQLRPEQQKRMANLMGWTHQDLNMYYQAALNIMPLHKAIANEPEPFFQKCIDVLTNSSDVVYQGPLKQPLNRMPGDEYQSEIAIDTIAECSMAMVGAPGYRWSSAYLLHPNIRPKNLRVVACANVDRVQFDRNANGELEASGVVIVGSDNARSIARLSRGGSVAVTSGAVGTAGVLQRSGIGPADKLLPLGIDVVVDNPEVGHGVDHQEIGVAYEWLTAWNDVNGKEPRGGATGWPLVVFATTDSPALQMEDRAKGEVITEQRKRNHFMQTHFGAGAAEPYTDNPCVVITPSCVCPDPQAGYRAIVTSTDPSKSMNVVHEDQRADLEAMARGVWRAVSLFESLQRAGLCGQRVDPPSEVDLADKQQVMQWIKENHGTVFHWASTCKAGLAGDVADERFRVRYRPFNGGSGFYNSGSPHQQSVIRNLFLGSAAVLPEIPEGNPHLSVTAFSVALAHEMLRDKYSALKRDTENLRVPKELEVAKKDLLVTGKPVIRRPGQERPAVIDVIVNHHKEWAEHHPEDEDEE